MKREEINIRDPFVLTRNGQYYLYGTRGATCWGPADGFDVYVSRDLENWDGPFECFHNDGTFWADRNYWAPEVHEYHGKLYMLASFKREDLCRGTAILTADNPLGPFVPHSDGRVTPSNWECLDGTLYVSPDDKPYLVFAHEWVQVGDGEICAMPLSDDLSRAIGEPKLLFHASEAEWARLVHHRSSGRDGYVTDGPSMFGGQFGVARSIADSKLSPVYAYAVETAIQLTLTEQNENLREIYIEAYSLPDTSEYIYLHTTAELKQIFGENFPNDTESDFYEMEIGTAGLMRSYMARKCDIHFPLERKLSRFLTAAMRVYRVPEEEQAKVLAFIQSLDIKAIATEVMYKLFAMLEMKYDFKLSKNGEMEVTK